MMTLQPNSRHCFVCGMENPFGLKLRFYKSGPDEVTVETTIPEGYQGFPDVVHGGIVSAMLDEVAARALLDGEPPRFMFTARLDIRYRKNVPVGQPLRVVGKALVVKKRTATATSLIYDASGAVLAQAEALLVNVPEESYQNEDLESLGWKVYPK